MTMLYTCDRKHLYGHSVHGTTRFVTLAEMTKEKDKRQMDIIATTGECDECGQVGPFGTPCARCEFYADGSYTNTPLLAKCLICQKPGLKWKPCNYGCYVQSKYLPMNQIPLKCEVCREEDYGRGREGTQCVDCYDGTLVQSFKGQIIFSSDTQSFSFPDDVGTVSYDPDRNITLIPIMSEQYLLKDGPYLLGTSIHGTARAVDLTTLNTIKDRWWEVVSGKTAKCFSCGEPGIIGDFCTNCSYDRYAETIGSQLAICLVCRNLGSPDSPCEYGCLVQATCVAPPDTPIQCDSCPVKYFDTPGVKCGNCKTGTLRPSFKGLILFSETKQSFEFPDD